MSPRLSADGRWAAYAQTNQTIWVAEVNRTAPQRFATGPRFTSYALWRRPGVLSWYVESNLYPSDWSPDGETLLVTGVAQTEKARRDIYRWDSATDTLAPWLVTPVDEFGLFPAWRPDERELFFVGRTGGIYAAMVTAGTTLSVATPEKLFDARIMADDRVVGAPFDVTPDGQRFLAVVIANRGQPPTLIQNLGALIARAQASPTP